MVQDAGFPAEIGLMGSGIQMWLQIIWFICRLNENSTIILDEPDVYMHPDLQRKVLRIVKSKYKQVIIATHSVEIISDVNAKNILKIDKMTRRMNYATDLKGVQNIVNNIGSVQNLSLIRLGDSKRCLFVEGKDVKMLSKYYEILYPNGDACLEMVPWISLGGWTRFSEALGTARLFNEETKGDIRTICILDRDYHLEDEINKLYSKASESHLELHVWSRKEIENYLLNPKVIFRLTGLDNTKYDEFYKSLDIEIDTLKNDVIDHYSQEIKKLHSNKDIITANREARKFIDCKWNSLEEKFNLVNGKDAISIINSWMKSKYKKNCSAVKILSKFKPEDIHDDVVKVLNRIV
jgi:predicted ATP-dependent endonuclease of OLD family